MFKYREKLSRDFILKHVTEEEIFIKYLGIKPNTLSRIKNPLRKDSRPDCRFYYDKRGVLKFHDFPMGWNWDCFNLVQHIFNCSFIDALKTIAIDFELYNGTKTTVNRSIEEISKKQPKVKYRVTRGNWKPNTLVFWKRFDLDAERLVQYCTSPVDVLWIDRGQGLTKVYEWSNKDPCYVFHFGKYNYKFYFPLRTRDDYRPRFLESVDDKDLLQGELQLPKIGDFLIITKSYKDVIVLATFGISAVAPLGESVTISKAKLDDLKRRFKNIYSLMDFDKTGVSAANRLKRDGIPYLFFTNGKFNTEDFGAKDFSEFIENYGINETNDLIEYVYTKIEAQ